MIKKNKYRNRGRLPDWVKQKNRSRTAAGLIGPVTTRRVLDPPPRPRTSSKTSKIETMTPGRARNAAFSIVDGFSRRGHDRNGAPRTRVRGTRRTATTAGASNGTDAVTALRYIYT